MIIRHGFSTWNKKNLFTGWVDVDLCEIGVGEASAAGKVIKDSGFVPDVVFTSVLKRAVDTASMILDEIGLTKIEAIKSWKLNERHYGALTGLDKKETVEKFGPEQVLIWRRSYDVAPPPLSKNSNYDFSIDPLYADVDSSLIPKTECLKDVVARVLPYFKETIAPRLLDGENVFVVAHGNSLRALIMQLEDIPVDQIANFELPTATPRLYKFDSSLNVQTFGYIEDENQVALRAKAVKDQVALGKDG